tara:strand:+ start:32 stop:808 length:777 start_codon:yes stop_codon:yes gene_type:complete
MIRNTKKFLKFAMSFADQSGEILKNNFFGECEVEKKNDGTLVTNIDKEIEEKFRKRVKKEFADHGVIGEEFGKDKTDSEYVWVIDPLDGTHSFISGKPLFGTLICCLHNRKPIIGIVDIPIQKQRWFGGQNLGVQQNKIMCKNSNSEKDFHDLIVSSTSFFMFNKKEQVKIKEIYNQAKFPVFGNDCYSYGLLLSEKIDLIVEANMKPWDYLAQVALINEFGGYISDWDGNELGLNSDGKVIASLNKKHHRKLINQLK